MVPASRETPFANSQPPAMPRRCRTTAAIVVAFIVLQFDSRLGVGKKILDRHNLMRISDLMPALPTMHLVACFHTLLTDEYSHCAFTGKCRRWAKMMQPYGWDVIRYCNEGSVDDPAAKETVHILNAAEFAEYYSRTNKTQFHGDHATTIGVIGITTLRFRRVSRGRTGFTLGSSPTTSTLRIGRSATAQATTWCIWAASPRPRG